MWLSLKGGQGTEQGGRRPCLVLSKTQFNERGLCFAVPITNTPADHLFRKKLPNSMLTNGYAMMDQMRCLDWTCREAEVTEKAPLNFVLYVAEVTKKIY